MIRVCLDEIEVVLEKEVKGAKEEGQLLLGVVLELKGSSEEIVNKVLDIIK